jgi:hypothetical protein
MLQNLRMRMVIIGELFGFLWRRKLWWMLPLVAMLMVLGSVCPGCQQFGDCPVYLHVILGGIVAGWQKE